jgi:SAM-dependent methyltransferase
VISPAHVSIVRCPDCGSPLQAVTSKIRCASCGREFDATRGYLDLRPAAAFAEQTKYLDEALHVDARHESVAPPLLGSRIRNGRLREFLALAPGDHALDLGCGSGRALVWNSDTGATLTGIDISPFFSREAIDRCELILGDLRRLPFQDNVFSKAWSLDVFEHLSPQALRDVLHEAHRVLAPGGSLFVYTHVRKNGWAASGVRLVNRFAGLCERAGLIDLRQERLRKSDHLNPIADHDELRMVVGEAGFDIERVTYYTPVVGAFIENVLARMAERFMTRIVQRSASATAAASARSADDHSSRAVRAAAKARIERRGPTYWILRMLSAAMMVDIWLFGHVKSGPFFALLRRRPGAHP